MRLNHGPKRLLLATLLLCTGCGEPSRYGTLPDVSVVEPDFSFLTSGLDVDASPPKSWTDVVIKIIPNLSITGGEGISAADREASAFRTVILADVAKPGLGGGAYRLRRMGIGLSIPINGRDTVVTMGTREAQGVALSKASKFALFAIEDDLHQSTLLAGTPTFALIGTRARLKTGSSYRKLELRYAVLVDPSSGALSRAIWQVEREKSGPSIVELSGDPVVNIPMTVIIERAMSVVPKGVKFGMDELPKGQPESMPSALAAISARERYSPAESAELEKAVRAALQGKGTVASNTETPR